MQNKCYTRKTQDIENPVKKKALFQYNQYQRCYAVKNISSLSFLPVSIAKVKDIIKTLNTKKACPDGDIPVKLMKMNEDII